MLFLAIVQTIPKFNLFCIIQANKGTISSKVMSSKAFSIQLRLKGLRLCWVENLDHSLQRSKSVSQNL